MQQPTSFDSLPLSKEVRRAIDELGYTTPTPVQLAVFDPASRGKDLVVQARTGTGKTAAFGLPIVDSLVRRSVRAVQALVLTPTRELALQVARELSKLGQYRDVSVAAVYGGVGIDKQIQELAAGAQVVIGTPGRVLDHLRRGTMNASELRIFVLDEADEMLSMGFAKELHAIVSLLPKQRQGLFFSATIPSTIERMATSQLKDPEFITLSSDQVGALEIAHYVYHTRGDKREALLRVLEVENPENAIIFCNTKDETERLAALLQQRGYSADWLNGDLEQRERERVMTGTREGHIRFLVCTDVAARGIDISHLTHVINADFPQDAETYVHRTGRTGRAGKTGTAISLVGPKDIGNLYLLRLSYKLRPLEKQLPTEGELKTRAEQDLVETFLEAYANEAHDEADIALAQRLLTHESATQVLAGLLRAHLGDRGKKEQGAAERRRAKNPEPVPIVPVRSASGERKLSSVSITAEVAPQASTEGRPATSDGPTTLRQSGSASQERGDRGDRGGRRRSRRGAGDGGFESGSVVGYTEEATPGFTEADAPAPGFTEGAAPAASSDRTDRGRSRRTMPSRELREGSGGSAEENDGFAQIFVNVGRRDGVSPADIIAIVTSRGNIPESEVGRVRMRERVSFVGVKPEHVDDAIVALAGQSLGGRTVVAEKARASTA
ncbi:MAG: DEAD/DEAH box helicase [Polyangiaceae bacterium]